MRRDPGSDPRASLRTGAKGSSPRFPQEAPNSKAARLAGRAPCLFDMGRRPAANSAQRERTRLPSGVPGSLVSLDRAIPRPPTWARAGESRVGLGLRESRGERVWLPGPSDTSGPWADSTAARTIQISSPHGQAARRHFLKSGSSREKPRTVPSRPADADLS
jgi:hypothetical protein